MLPLKPAINALLKFAAGTYFLLVSLYCLLAYLPYTFCAFIKTPPYSWMPWLAHHQALLYWLSVIALVAATGPERWFSEGSIGVRRWGFAGTGLLAAGGTYLTFRPFLPSLQDNTAAFVWGLVSLLPLAGIAGVECVRNPLPQSTTGRAIDDNRGARALPFSSILLAAFAVSAIYASAERARFFSENGTLGLHFAEIEIALWSLASHMALSIAVLSAINLILLTASKTPQPRPMARLMLGTGLTVALGIALARFVGSAMSFDGWRAWAYATALAVTLTLWGFSLVEPFSSGPGSSRISTKPSSRSVIATWVAMALIVMLALSSRALIGGEDWNGFVASTSALLCWIGISICIYRLRPARASYSFATIVGALVISSFVYVGLRATEIFWARPLGSTDDEISLRLEQYGENDASFLLAHHILGNGRGVACGDLCRIMRDYTNIRDGRTQAEVSLVDNLIPTSNPRPNIFIIVVDAMRPDYLGAYNPRVYYTPNLDAFARDSIVLHNAYSQYAGTSLSEPALWSGAMMLHAHYVEPFTNVNSLEKLLRVDGYHMYVSMDDVVKEVLSPADNMTKLDTDKQLWNQLEIGSTVQEAEAALDARTDKQTPVFFYAQPKNVHQFARNDVPSPTSQHWQSPTGMNSRITYEVHWVDSRLGEFFDYLKRRKMYDSSIIIVTSDHGDATGEFGRSSHSTSIWPEIMRVPMIIHLPAALRAQVIYDDTRLSTLTDVVPSLYYLLGHRSIRRNPIYGRPLFAATRQELDSYPAKDLLLASDVRAVYGILTADGRYLYATYDSPAQSYLFDLARDPNAEHSILTPALKQQYDEEIIEHLHTVGDFYGYRPSVGSLVASVQR